MENKTLYTVIVRSEEEKPNFKYFGTFDEKEKAHNAITDDFRFWSSEDCVYYDILQDGQSEYLIIPHSLNEVVDIPINNELDEDEED